LSSSFSITLYLNRTSNLVGLFVRPCLYIYIYIYTHTHTHTHIQGGSDMTGTDLCVNKPQMSRSYLNHLVYTHIYTHIRLCHILELRLSQNSVFLRKVTRRHRRKSYIELIFKNQGVKMLAAGV